MSVSVKISQLVEGGNVNGADYLPVARGATNTFKIAASQFVVGGQNAGFGSGLFIGAADGAGRSLRFRSLSGVDGLQVINVGDTTIISASGQNPVKTSLTSPTVNGTNFIFPVVGAVSINPNNYRVDIDGVLQESIVDYNINGSNIVFTSPPPNGSKVTIVNNNLVRAYDIIPSDGSVTSNKIYPEAVTTGKIALSSVTNAKIAFDGGAFSFRNKIINGNFDFWQRGTSFTRSGGFSQPYTSDRWFAIGTASSLTVNQQSFSLGQTSVPNEPQYFCQCIVTTSPGSTSYAALGHRIENVRTLSGKTAVLTFWAKADSNKSISIEFSQHFGSGGSPSAQILELGVQKLNLTTSWQKFTVLVSVPSIAGKTLGTNNNDHFIVGFWFDAGSNYNSRTNNLGQQSGTFDIAQVQLEEGPVATPFEQRPIGLELSLCQRYYEQNIFAQTIGIFNNIISAWTIVRIPFMVRKRSIPTITTNVAGNNFVVVQLESSTPLVGITENGFAIQVSGAATTNLRSINSTEYYVNAEL